MEQREHIRSIRCSLQVQTNEKEKPSVSKSIMFSALAYSAVVKKFDWYVKKLDWYIEIFYRHMIKVPFRSNRSQNQQVRWPGGSFAEAELGCTQE